MNPTQARALSLIREGLDLLGIPHVNDYFGMDKEFGLIRVELENERFFDIQVAPGPWCGSQVSVSVRVPAQWYERVYESRKEHS